VRSHIIKSSIASKITHQAIHVSTSTLEYTKAYTVMSAKSTPDIVRLFAVTSPSVQLTFKNRNRSTTQRVEMFSIMFIMIHICCCPVFPGHVAGLSLTDEQSSVQTFHAATSHILQLITAASQC